MTQPQRNKPETVGRVLKRLNGAAPAINPTTDQTSAESKQPVKKLVVGKLSPQSNMYVIKYDSGGGEVPDNLKGQFTSKVFAQLAINKWLSKEQNKQTLPL